MADMMKAMGGKGRRQACWADDGGLGAKMGMPPGMAGGAGGMMPDLSKMDPKQLEALQQQASAMGMAKGATPDGLPGLGGAKLPGGLPGLGGTASGLPGKKK